MDFSAAGGGRPSSASPGWGRAGGALHRDLVGRAADAPGADLERRLTLSSARLRYHRVGVVRRGTIERAINNVLGQRLLAPRSAPC